MNNNEYQIGSIRVKEVHGFKYYWNVRKQQWEGLINNATPVKKEPMTKRQWQKYFDENEKIQL